MRPAATIACLLIAGSSMASAQEVASRVTGVMDQRAPRLVEADVLPTENTGMSPVVRGMSEVSTKTMAAGRDARSQAKETVEQSDFCAAFKKR